MNAVFTIVAKNYYAQALTLGDSIRKIHPDLDFYIFLVDESDRLMDLTTVRYRTLASKSIGIGRFSEMAFKYDVVEFATAIKPFCFDYLFKNYSYDKIIYFDPDIYVYSSLDLLYELLNDSFIVLTPHFLRMDLTSRGASLEEDFLFVGIYNLGFIALRNTEDSFKMLDWWKVKLEDKCFADRQDALHVDQKWMDLIPLFFEKGVCISRDPGHNTAFWNIHERQLSTKNNENFIDEHPLVFFHFASIDPLNPDGISRRQIKFSLSSKPEYRKLFEDYTSRLLANGFDSYSKYPYTYSRFHNGISIFPFQRRIYRRLLQMAATFEDPFATDPDSFYDLLRKNGLIIEEKTKTMYKRSDFRDSGSMIKWFLRFMRLLKILAGPKYYHLLLRVLHKYSRSEEQVFLLRKGIKINVDLH